MFVIPLTENFKFRKRSTCSKGPLKRAGKSVGIPKTWNHLECSGIRKIIWTNHIFCWFWRTEHHLSSFKMWFSEHFSRQSLLRSLSRLLFLVQWNKYGAKKCKKNHIPFDFWDDSILANQEAGNQKKPLKELPWNQQFCFYVPSTQLHQMKRLLVKEGARVDLSLSNTLELFYSYLECS